MKQLDSTPKCPVCGGQNSKLERLGTGYSFLCCYDCGVHYIDPLEPALPPQSLFNDYAWTRDYNQDYEVYLPLVQRSLQYKLMVVESLTGCRAKSMLDVGCGNGLYLHAGKLMGLEVVGTEVDETSAMIARRHGLDVRIGVVEETISSGLFDFIHVRQVLHLCPRPLAMLENLARRLATGGIMYLDASNQDGLFSRIRRVLRREPTRYGQLIPPRHCVSYNRHAFQELLNRTGLSPDRIFTYSAYDRIYYPFRPRSFRMKAEYCVKSGADFFKTGAFLAAYCRASSRTPVTPKNENLIPQNSIA
jgi:SAM-dependent methyltransferase